MTTPKQALEQIAARSIAQDDDDEKELRRQLYHIESLAKSALASLQGEDAVERVARIIDPDAMRLYDECRGSGRVAANGKLLADVAYSEGRNGALTKARAILATGLVPDEAAVRGDEREKCAKAAESVYADPNYHMFFRQAGDVIAAAIRSNRREA